MKQHIEEEFGFNFLSFIDARNKSLLNTINSSFEDLVADKGLQKLLSLVFSGYNSMVCTDQFIHNSMLVSEVSTLVFDKNKYHPIYIHCVIIAFYLLDETIDYIPDFSVKFDLLESAIVYMRRSNIYLNLPARQSIIVSKLKNNLQVKSVDSIKEIKIISNKNQQNTNHSLNLICQSISSLSELKGYSVDEDVNLNSFKNVLSNALLNIKYADKELYNTLLTIIDTIILIRLPDNIPSHKRSNYSVSFSQGKNIGSIFISFTENDFWLTETLVHEFGHNLLNILMLSKDLIADEEATFYSPWRDEPRPAHGLLHALFSFSYAASLMGKLFVLVNDRSNKEFIKNRLIAHAYRLKFGFEENLQSALTDAGKSVYRIINNYFLTSSCNNFLNSPCPARILEHRNRRVRT